MIIDEILDAKYNNNIVDIEYIKEMAELLDFDYIIKAILNKDPEETRQALALYIRLNGYNLEIIENELEQIKIVFDEPSKAEKIRDILQYLETHNKNYTKKQYSYILELRELLEG